MQMRHLKPLRHLKQLQPSVYAVRLSHKWVEIRTSRAPLKPIRSSVRKGKSVLSMVWYDGGKIVCCIPATLMTRPPLGIRKLTDEQVSDLVERRKEFRGL